MGNLFDSLKNSAFDVVTNTMGVDAEWTPSVGGATQYGKVLFNQPTGKEEINEIEYTPLARYIEYRAGVFTGLFESVRAGENEWLIIEGVKYHIQAITAGFDGGNYKAVLEISRNQ